MIALRHIYIIAVILSILLTCCKEGGTIVCNDAQTTTVNQDNNSAVPPQDDRSYDMLIASDSGLYIYNTVTKNITKTYDTPVRQTALTNQGVMLLTDSGIVYTPDGRSFDERSDGIHRIQLKVKTESGWSYTPICHLVDLEVCPTNDSIMITADKNGVYLTTDAGQNWTFMRSPSVITGLKSVAVTEQNGTIRMFVSHAYKGIFTKLSTDKRWTNISSGLIQFGTQYEEIGDIRIAVNNDTNEIYASTNFTPAIYRLNGDKWDMIYRPADVTEFDLIEDMRISEGTVSFSSCRGRMTINTGEPQMPISKSSPDEKIAQLCREIKAAGVTDIRSVTFCEANSQMQRQTYNHLNLTDRSAKTRYPQAKDKAGIYLTCDILRDQDKLDSYITFMKKIGLNAIILDVKDDDGNLRWDAQSAYLNKIGNVSEPVSLDSLITTARDNDIYLIGRIVLFKDKHLYEYDNHKYAVLDSAKLSDNSADDKSWRGWYKIKNRNRKSDSDPEYIRRYCKEYWCDPYSADVWEYNCAIANEIVRRGINEIQFDYIRFPTDGGNLGDAVFSYRNKKYDTRESCILSFLNYARQTIPAPLSIDVYGANGWFRTGGSTGQDVSTLSHYVDAICPMYYPSHFDDDFQSHDPAEKRPYRIYYYGSMRCKYIADCRTIVRPYLQAFRLYTEYDKKYFGQDYILGQLAGIRDSINEGYTFWDMLDDYKHIMFLAE